MKYNFDAIVERKHTGSLKWNVGENELPMWVADMDFPTAPEIRRVLEERVSHGIFGYTEVDDEWRQAYVSWWGRRHHWEIRPQWLIFSTGIIPIISSTVRKLTSPNENVVIQAPVYHIFYNCILNNGCNVLENPLIYENGRYSIDFEDLEKKLADPQTSLMILCNPQNPSGNIWTKEELARIGELCVQNGVTVISDEIHCDLTLPGKEYIPFASVSENCRECSITCISPTKTFNIAGLQSAAAVVPNRALRHKVWRALNTDEVAEPNVFAIPAAVTAFNEGEEWLDQLREYLAKNRHMAEEYVDANIPGAHVVRGEATYLIWIDYSGCTTLGSAEVAKNLRRDTGLYLSEGIEFGAKPDTFLRMNIACPREVLADGLERLKRGLTK